MAEGALARAPRSGRCGDLGLRVSANVTIRVPPSVPPSAPACLAPEDLLGAIATRRDRTAFADLFREFAPRIKAFLLARGVQRENADELVQDVMLTIWRRAEQFDKNRGAARTWIFTIARNCLVDRVRAARRPEAELDDPARVEESPISEAAVLAP
ncbi:MAG TPA: sigma factor, partial [Polyangia bacterium]